VKAEQDIKHTPKVMTNSAKVGHKKNPRRLYGPDYKPKIAAAPAVEIRPDGKHGRPTMKLSVSHPSHIPTARRRLRIMMTI
jgi:hypothetical protein